MPARSAKLSNRGKCSSALRRFGPLPQRMGPCNLTTRHYRFRLASWPLAETPHRNRRGGHWCSRSRCNSVPLRKRLTQMCLILTRAVAPPSAYRIEFCSYRRSRHDPPLLTQEGRSPVQIGRASHSEQRIRRSSPPTLTKTKGASSRPVFEPTKIAGTP
jgi:hypothetical protein